MIFPTVDEMIEELIKKNENNWESDPHGDYVMHAQAFVYEYAQKFKAREEKMKEFEENKTEKLHAAVASRNKRLKDMLEKKKEFDNSYRLRPLLLPVPFGCNNCKTCDPKTVSELSELTYEERAKNRKRGCLGRCCVVDDNSIFRKIRDGFDVEIDGKKVHIDVPLKGKVVMEAFGRDTFPIQLLRRWNVIRYAPMLVDVIRKEILASDPPQVVRDNALNYAMSVARSAGLCYCNRATCLCLGDCYRAYGELDGYESDPEHEPALAEMVEKVEPKELQSNIKNRESRYAILRSSDFKTGDRICNIDKATNVMVYMMYVTMWARCAIPTKPSKFEEWVIDKLGGNK